MRASAILVMAILGASTAHGQGVNEPMVTGVPAYPIVRPRIAALIFYFGLAGVAYWLESKAQTT